MDVVLVVLLGLVIALVLLVGSIGYLYFFRLWFRSHIAQCSVPLATIVKMFFSGGSPHIVLIAYIQAHKAGFSLALEDMEAHHKSKGDIKAVVQALIDSQQLGTNETFELLCEQELQKSQTLEH
jgi:uncharacterized protein YqfA (UPF0365 family)